MKKTKPEKYEDISRAVEVMVGKVEKILSEEDLHFLRKKYFDRTKDIFDEINKYLYKRKGTIVTQKELAQYVVENVKLNCFYDYPKTIEKILTRHASKGYLNMPRNIIKIAGNEPKYVYDHAVATYLIKKTINENKEYSNLDKIFSEKNKSAILSEFRKYALQNNDGIFIKMNPQKFWDYSRMIIRNDLVSLVLKEEEYNNLKLTLNSLS